MYAKVPTVQPLSGDVRADRDPVLPSLPSQNFTAPSQTDGDRALTDSFPSMHQLSTLVNNNNNNNNSNNNNNNSSNNSDDNIATMHTPRDVLAQRLSSARKTLSTTLFSPRSLDDGKVSSGHRSSGNRSSHLQSDSCGGGAGRAVSKYISMGEGGESAPILLSPATRYP